MNILERLSRKCWINIFSHYMHRDVCSRWNFNHLICCNCRKIINSTIHFLLVHFSTLHGLLSDGFLICFMFYIYMYTHTHTHIYDYTHTHICIHTHTHIYIFCYCYCFLLLFFLLLYIFVQIICLKFITIIEETFLPSWRRMIVIPISITGSTIFYHQRETFLQNFQNFEKFIEEMFPQYYRYRQVQIFTIQ